MSIDMTTALTSDTMMNSVQPEEIRAEVRQNANTEVIDTDDYVVMDEEQPPEQQAPQEEPPADDAEQIGLGF